MASPVMWADSRKLTRVPDRPAKRGRRTLGPGAETLQQQLGAVRRAQGNRGLGCTTVRNPGNRARGW